MTFQVTAGKKAQGIDVVIPCFNGARWIADTLDSVRRQSLKPGNIIVVDDHSSDGSREIVARCADVTLLENPRKGCAAARNFGFLFTRSSLVIFLDHDDLWHPHHLRILHDTLAGHPSCAYAVSGHKEFFDGRPPVFDLDDLTVREVDPWDEYPAYGFARTPGTTLYRREILLAAGLWNESYPGMTDYHLCLSAALGGPAARCNAKTLAYRKHPDSLIHRLRRHPKEYFAMMLNVREDLLRHALASSFRTERKALLRERHGYMRDIITAVMAIEVNDRPAAESALGRLDRGLSREPWQYASRMLHSLVFILEISCGDRGRTEYEPRFRALLDVYPGGFRGLKKALVYAINNFNPGLQFYLRHYAGRPWDLGRLYPLAMTMASGVRNRIPASRA